MWMFVWRNTCQHADQPAGLNQDMNGELRHCFVIRASSGNACGKWSRRVILHFLTFYLAARLDVNLYYIIITQIHH